MSIDAKICGLTTEAAVHAAAAGGARYVGFNFYPPSPRAVTPERAAELAQNLPDNVKIVAIVVDATDEDIAQIVLTLKPDFLQCHGSETAKRLDGIRDRFGISIIKAITVSSRKDIARAHEYEQSADMLLFDAKPPTEDADALPGGNGLAFDWELISGAAFKRPWILSGGLNPDNLGEAVRISHAHAVDVSSGVEDTPGHKNPDAVTRFLTICSELSETAEAPGNV